MSYLWDMRCCCCCWLWVQGFHLIHQVMYGHAPSYLADDCYLVTQTPTLTNKNALSWHLYSSCQSGQFRRQSLQFSWTSSLEQSVDRPQTAGLVMQPFQTVAEDIFIWSLWAKRSKNSCPFNCALYFLLLTIFLSVEILSAVDDVYLMMTMTLFVQVRTYVVRATTALTLRLGRGWSCATHCYLMTRLRHHSATVSSATRTVSRCFCFLHSEGKGFIIHRLGAHLPV